MQKYISFSTVKNKLHFQPKSLLIQTMCLLLLVANILMVFPTPVHAGTGDDYPEPWKSGAINQYTDTWGYSSRNCTSWAAWALHSRNGFQMPWAIGNAANWGIWAAANNHTVNTTPAKGAIAWWPANAPDNGHSVGSSGHVAWVSAVNNNTATIEEYNYGGTGNHNTRSVTRSSTQQVQYIHFKDITASPPTAQPDADADGVPDSEDYCPNVRGLASNHGCPNSVTQVSGDLDGDGKGDVIAISRGPNTEPMISWLKSTGTSTSSSVLNPEHLITLPAPAWNVDNLKWTVGDWNGDGKDDLFVASGSGSGPINMYQLLSTGTGLLEPVLVKQPPHPAWQWDRLEYFAGDVGGDGKDDVVAISKGLNNEPTINLLASTSTNTSASMADPTPLKSLSAPAWNVNNLKWAVGDYTGDGKDDLFAASGSVSDPVSMYIFKSTGTSLDNPVLVKQPSFAAWKWDRLTFTKANIDGDSKDDILAISRGYDNAPSIHWFWSTSTSSTVSLADSAPLRSMPAPAWNVGNLKLAIIDNNGDGKDDLFAASGSVSNPVSMYVFRTYLNGTAGWTLDTPNLVNSPNPAAWHWVALQF